MIEIDKLSEEELKNLKVQLKEKEAEQRLAQAKAYNELKSEGVVTLVETAKKLSGELKEFKEHAFETMDALYQVLKEYSGRGGVKDKGNFKMEFEGYKVEYSCQGKGSYDERAGEAEKYVFEFIQKRYSGDEATKEFIKSLLERKRGNLDPDNIQKLYNYKDIFKDEDFSKACELFQESYRYEHSKDYIRFYQKDERGEWVNVGLQFSAL